MRKIVIITSIIFISLFTLYSGAWYVLSNNVSKALIQSNNIAKYGILSKNNIILSDISVSGFPFNIGAKSISIKEETSDRVIHHDGTLYVGYNILTQSLYSYYSGTLKEQSNNNSSISFSSDSKTYCKIPLSISVIKILLKKDRFFELFNFIKNVESSTTNKGYNSEDNSLLLDQTIYISLNTNNTNYYTSLDEMMADNTKYTYGLKFNITVNKNDIENDNLPISIFYPKLHQLSLNSIDFDGNITASFKNRINDFSVQINSLKYDTESYSGESSCYAHINLEKENIAIAIKGQDNATIKDNFYDHLNKSLFVDGISKIINEGVPAPIASIVGNISENPQKYYFPKNDLKAISTNLDLSISSDKGSNLNIDINQLDIFFDETGIRIADKTLLSHAISLVFASNGVLSIRNSNNILDYWSNYLSQLFPEKNERIYLVKKTMEQYLRSISEHPESTNTEMLFDFSFDSVNKDLKIGQKKSEELLSVYKQYLYQNALELAKSDIDFMKKAPNIIPELLDDKTIMQNLQNAANNAITTSKSVTSSTSTNK